MIKTCSTDRSRVHRGAKGYTMAGDVKYGNFGMIKGLQKLPAGQALKRMFLHAWTLKFTHPSNGKRITLLAELPPELAALVAHVPPAEF